MTLSTLAYNRSTGRYPSAGTKPSTKMENEPPAASIKEREPQILLADMDNALAIAYCRVSGLLNTDSGKSSVLDSALVRGSSSTTDADEV